MGTFFTCNVTAADVLQCNPTFVNLFVPANFRTKPYWVFQVPCPRKCARQQSGLPSCAFLSGYRVICPKRGSW